MKPNWDDAPIEATHWCEAKNQWRDETEESIGECCIRIPDGQPAAPEWDGESAKHVGMKFQSSLGECELMAIDSNKVTCCVRFLDSGHLQFCSLDALEPLRTKEQRERDELANFLNDYVIPGGFNGNLSACQDYAECILAKYDLTRKEAD